MAIDASAERSLTHIEQGQFDPSKASSKAAPDGGDDPDLSVSCGEHATSTRCG